MQGITLCADARGKRETGQDAMIPGLVQFREGHECGDREWPRGHHAPGSPAFG